MPRLMTPKVRSLMSVILIVLVPEVEALTVPVKSLAAALAAMFPPAEVSWRSPVVTVAPRVIAPDVNVVRDRFSTPDAE